MRGDFAHDEWQGARYPVHRSGCFRVGKAGPRQGPAYRVVHVAKT